MTATLEQGGTMAKAQAEALLLRIRDEIPLTVAMQLRVQACEAGSLTLAVPLAPNINDKGTAFAGSITALGCITGWCLLTLWAERELGPCQVAIHDARFTFKKPLRGDFTATATLPSPQECSALLDTVRRRGKGRIALPIALADAEGVATELDGSYAVWLNRAGAPGQ